MTHTYPLSVFLTAGLMLLSACGTATSQRTPITDKTYPPAPMLETDPNSAPPAAVTDALIPAFDPSQLSEAPAPASGFNISVHEVEAREFFMSLVFDSQENMVVHPDVTGRISLELKNVTVPQVLSAVQKVYGYDYSKTDIGYIVYPASLQTKIFKIDRIDLLREGVSSTRVSSGQINTGNRRLGNLNQMNTGANPAVPGGGNYANQNNNTSGSWINTTSKTDFWDELQQSLGAIVDVMPTANNSDEMQNPQTGGKVVLNKQTGIVVVRANPGQMREVEKLVASTQDQLGRQVVIEAKILEIELNDEHQDGVNWASMVRDGTNAFLMASNPIPAMAANAISSSTQVFTVSGNIGDFYAFISLMERQGKTNILSSPRISTLNNQKAVIKVGQDEYFITDVSSNNILTGGSATNTVTQDITWTPFFSGIALDVTPQIADNNKVTLHIHPSITRVRGEDKTFTINGQDGSIPMALNTVRESDSIVHAENGQIIVIGGLMQEDREENKSGVAFFSRIPYLGNLFRENKGNGRKSELVILLKPTIIGNSQDWNAPMEDSRQRMESLEKKQLWR
ncbi:pilus (MSHA type) biogenesis protein MshL [Methylomonas sp. SURF-2]|uniref:Pilus (MSHA type) biogenesis protein MshL n=1 Tax=Methylomonas subterranea TaxID=2952225 RepID=A0ABT1TIL6_9GAMM|nr:pilus (MSHA type) biogenesis protein MshL [Methylomonas sp. SURF-2]MCQ8105078.1 pilus (MSHA type) biogenesis protein MshL [Methylomonas sp. SURF-2]